MAKKLVAYYRVSTKKQGQSGLGLEGQVAAVEAYRQQHGAEIIRTYQEVESGKRADRPELAKAIAHANRSGATLVIAKLDRLSRNVAFLATLMETMAREGELVCCDNPYADRFNLHILACVAELEAKQIGNRTKAALAAYKARGGLMGASRPGGRRLTLEHCEKGRAVALQVRAEQTKRAYDDLARDVITMYDSGYYSLRLIASWLDREGHTTRRGKPWNPVQVRRLVQRYGTTLRPHLDLEALQPPRLFQRYGVPGEASEAIVAFQ